MSQIAQSPFFDYLGQKVTTLDIYRATFKSAEPVDIEGFKYLSAREEGISLSLSKTLEVKSVFLFAEGVDGFRQYKHSLPNELSFLSSRAVICQQLGAPSRSGEAGGIGIMAVSFAWDRYDLDRDYLHIEYTKGENRIRILTIGRD
jgi:hypothetical protein